MGVHSLWSLLEPVGRRVNIEAIQNKRLAVGGWDLPVPWISTIEKKPRGVQCNAWSADASIWIWQFQRAMRDDRGEMVKNAHLKGFFSRICR